MIELIGNRKEEREQEDETTVLCLSGLLWSDNTSTTSCSIGVCCLLWLAHSFSSPALSLSPYLARCLCLEHNAFCHLILSTKDTHTQAHRDSFCICFSLPFRAFERPPPPPPLLLFLFASLFRHRCAGKLANNRSNATYALRPTTSTQERWQKRR